MRNGKIITNNELGRMWKEAARLKALFCHVLGGTEKDHKKFQPGCFMSNPRFEIRMNSGPPSPKYESGILSIEV
jgi:hypothetical protein